MPKGRKSLLNKNLLNLEYLKKLYSKLHTAKKVSKEIGFSYCTVRKYLKLAGIKLQRGFPKSLESRKHTSKFIQWIRENPEVKLPRSIVKISKITGVKEYALRSYFQRRRRKIREFLKTLPNLKTLDIKFRDLNNRIIPTKFIDAYKLYYDSWDFKIKIIAKIKNLKSTIEVSEEELRRKIDEQNRKI